MKMEQLFIQPQIHKGKYHRVLKCQMEYLEPFLLVTFL